MGQAKIENYFLYQTVFQLSEVAKAAEVETM